VRLPVSKQASCAFGGPGHRQLFVLRPRRAGMDEAQASRRTARRTRARPRRRRSAASRRRRSTRHPRWGASAHERDLRRLPSPRRPRRRPQPRAGAVADRPHVGGGRAHRLAGSRHGFAYRTGYGRRPGRRRRRAGSSTRSRDSRRTRTWRPCSSSPRPNAINEPYVEAIAKAGKPAVALVAAGRARGRAGAGRSRRARGDAARARRVALRRERCDVAALCVAVECGHSDATSGLVGQPARGPHDGARRARGRAGDVQRDVEWTGAEHLLARRAADADVAQRIVRAVVERERLVRASGRDTRAQNPGRRTRPAASRRSRRRRSARSPRAATSRSADCSRRRAPDAAGPVPDGHAVLLARVDHRDGRRGRAALRVHDRRRQQLLQPDRADAQAERESRRVRAPDRADRHRRDRRAARRPRRSTRSPTPRWRSSATSRRAR
jgi:hypothetical protein